MISEWSTFSGADADVGINGYLEILRRNLESVLSVKAPIGINPCEKQEQGKKTRFPYVLPKYAIFTETKNA